ncbi:hypothetical protein [Caballeronia arationis]|jgi:hypothetical protein|uniref:hypothetical protein n=1 Tax=Caballeronia arationis TaxID=1777142 RepID=UPI000A6D3DDB|nr:hypothetical protein [Caballeronia arationis]
MRDAEAQKEQSGIDRLRSGRCEKALTAIYHKAHSQADGARQRLKNENGADYLRNETVRHDEQRSAQVIGRPALNHRFRPCLPHRAKRGRPNRRVLSAKSIAGCMITQHEFIIDGKKPL